MNGIEPNPSTSSGRTELHPFVVTPRRCSGLKAQPACPPKLYAKAGSNHVRIVVIIVASMALGQRISAAEFKLGIENIPQSIINQYVEKKIPVALITNQTGKDQKGNRTVDILIKKGFNVQVIFAPEHGFDGKSQAAQEIKDGRDVKTKIPVMSLYGKGTGKKVDPEMIKNIDAFFFDIQDSGMRHYTYISTLFTILKAAEEEKKKVIVFDRPNPLGKAMEGPLVESSLISFISIASIPLRHGMTLGELAEYFNQHVLEKQAALTVVPMKNYDRTVGIEHLHAPLSPNIASKESCHGYSFLGLLGEVKPFDVGVGTHHAFQLITLPESLALPMSVWHELAARLKTLGITATIYKYMNERKKEPYHGLHVTMTDINQVNAFNALLITVATMKKAGVPIDFQIAFDKAAGSKQVRLFLMGMIGYRELIEEVNSGLQSFFQKAQTVFKYLPHPESIQGPSRSIRPPGTTSSRGCWPTCSTAGR